LQREHQKPPKQSRNVVLTPARLSWSSERRTNGWRITEGPKETGGVPTEAELAVRAMGTSALPILLEWFRYELPLGRRILLKLATFRVQGKTLEEGKTIYGSSLIVGKKARRAEKADLGFVILNTNAVSAIPELEALMKNNHKPDRSLRAIYALGEIGGPAIPALTNALADPGTKQRLKIALN